MKMKKFWPRGGARVPGAPLGSATAKFSTPDRKNSLACDMKLYCCDKNNITATMVNIAKISLGQSNESSLLNIDKDGTV